MAFRQTVAWFLPYLVGRLYLTDVEALRELALGMIIGGLCLIPLCLFEIKMSPQLNYIVYGFGAFGAFEGTRWGGYRPRVFFTSGLELGLWMNATAWWLGGSGKPASSKCCGHCAGERSSPHC